MAQNVSTNTNIKKLVENVSENRNNGPKMLEQITISKKKMAQNLNVNTNIKKMAQNVSVNTNIKKNGPKCYFITS